MTPVLPIRSCFTFFQTHSSGLSSGEYPGRRNSFGAYPDVIAITPNGKTAYVTVPGNVFAAPGFVVPIRTATNTALKAIMVGKFPGAIAITPNGETAYVASNSGVTPISTAANKARQADQRNWVDPSRSRRTGRPPTPPAARTTVTPVSTATNTADKAITVGKYPTAIAITP